jgi:hypothetical protein
MLDTTLQETEMRSWATEYIKLAEDDNKFRWRNVVLPAAAAGAGIYAHRRGLFGFRPGALGEEAAAVARKRGIVAQTAQDAKRMGASRIDPDRKSILDKVKSYFQYGTPHTAIHPKPVDPRGRVTLMEGYSPFGSDKLLEQETIQKLAPGMLPTGGRIQIAPGEVKNTAELAQAIRVKAKQVTGSDNFILKHPTDAMSGGGLMTEASLADGIATHQAVEAAGGVTHEGRFYTKAQLKRLEHVNPEKHTDILNSTGTRAHHHIQSLLEGQPLLAQQRVNVAPGGKEMRVHVYQGKVIPDLTFDRYDPESVGYYAKHLAGVKEPRYAAAEKWLQEKLDSSPGLQEYTKHHALGVDMAPTADGGHVVFETNPGFSGFLHPSGKLHPSHAGPAFLSHVRASKIMGRDTHLLAAAHALPATALVGGGAAGIEMLRKRKRQADNVGEIPR